MRRKRIETPRPKPIRVPCEISSLLDHQPFTQAVEDIRKLSGLHKRFVAASKYLAEKRKVDCIPVGFFTWKPFLPLAFCFDGGHDRKAGPIKRLNIGFWLSDEGRELKGLGVDKFNVFWSEAGALDDLLPDYIMRFYSTAEMTLDELFSRPLRKDMSLYLNPDLPDIIVTAGLR